MHIIAMYIIAIYIAMCEANHNFKMIISSKYITTYMLCNIMHR